MNFIEILQNGKLDEIKRAIEDVQFDYYANNCESKKINLGFFIPNYSILMTALDCNDSGNPIINESFGDDLYFKVLTIYETGIIGAYFSRIEEFGPADVDAMKCTIIITDNIEREAEKILSKYANKSVIKERIQAENKMDKTKNNNER